MEEEIWANGAAGNWPPSSTDDLRNPRMSGKSWNPFFVLLKSPVPHGACFTPRRMPGRRARRGAGPSACGFASIQGSRQDSLRGLLPPPLGGTTVSFKQLKEYLEERQDVSAETINSFGVRGSGISGVILLARMLLNIFRGARRADVVALHCSTTALYSFALIVLLLARIAQRPILIRRYGGATIMIWPIEAEAGALCGVTCGPQFAGVKKTS